MARRNHGNGRTRYAVWFDQPPEINFRMPDPKGGIMRVSGIEPYTRKDGRPSFVISWEDEDGRTAKTGMTSTVNSFHWKKCENSKVKGQK